MKRNINHYVLAGLALASTGLSSLPALAANAKVCFEAEVAGQIDTPLTKVLGSAARPYSGRGYIDIPWDRNVSKGKGQAVYHINVKKPGAYYVWARTFWGNGCGNSIKVSVNGSDRILGEDGTYGAWHWVNSTTRVSLKQGLNTIVLKNNETGIRVDQFFFCQDAQYTPVGIRTPNV